MILYIKLTIRFDLDIDKDSMDSQMTFYFIDFSLNMKNIHL